MKHFSGPLVASVSSFVVAILLALYYKVSEQHGNLTHEMVSKFNNADQSTVCISLAASLPESIYSAHHSVFRNTMSSYWSLTAREALPSCIVQAANTEEVTKAIQIIDKAVKQNDTAENPIRFAVKSGGHSPTYGVAGIHGGILVDLSRINSVTVSADKKSVLIGMGARWRDVYNTLDSMELAMVGGRNADVGVGGLVLGGGISFFSPQYGMVCDNINSYEIVLANGEALNVSATQHEDLWRALKGGTGNFGIVTHVEAKVFTTGRIWSGYAYWPSWSYPKLLQTFTEFNKPEKFDKFASGPILAFFYVQQIGLKMCASSLAYTKPIAWPPVFEGFKSHWRVWSTTKVQSVSDSTKELQDLAPSGSRQHQVTITIKNDLETLNAFHNLFNESLQKVKSVRGGIWSLIVQPLSPAMTRKGNPNVLGLETRDAGDVLVIVLLSVIWKDKKDDALVYQLSRELLLELEAYAESKGTADSFRYLNYAAIEQDPITRYGIANKEFLQTISKKYDPDGFFQRIKQGGFKLDLF